MTKSCVIAFDVGGTSIKAGIVDEQLNIYGNEIKTYPAYSDKNSETILGNIVEIVYDQWAVLNSNDYVIKGLGFGFPSPFDYEKGISYIKNIGKYDAIYGIDIASYLKNRLLKDNKVDKKQDFPILFENDAAVFALGEYLKGNGTGCKRLMCITLGTGCGATFLDNGKIVKGLWGVPENGMIFDQPYKDSIVDEYISRRGILRIASGLGFDIDSIDVKELNNMAREGNAKAMEVFYRFGLCFGEVLNPFIKNFKPDKIILGGRIAKGFDLFSNGMKEYIADEDFKFSISDNLSISALIGAGSLVFGYQE